MVGILRHGKTDWNLVHKIQGRTDIPLNEEGIASARETRDHVAECNFDICYVSPLVRARQTAEIITEGLKVPVIVDKRLMEIGFGKYEGIAGVYGVPDHPLHDFFFAPDKYVADNGAESLDELMSRVKDFCGEILDDHVKAGRNVLIVAHGALNAALITFLLGNERKDFWRYGQSNCSMFRFYPEDRERTLRENISTYG